MKKIVLCLLLAFSVLLFAAGCSSSKSKPVDAVKEDVEENYSDETSMDISDYVRRYNDALRRTVDSAKVSYGVSDEKYISCAKTLLDSKLKNPSSAVYNSESIYEKDSYGKAIVYLDVSSQNSFGGWVRKKFYVCIQSVNKDDTFHYSATMPYIDSESMSLYETFKKVNEFGSHPADSQLEGLLLDEERLEYAQAVTRSKDQSLDVYYAYTKCAGHSLYIDSQTEKIVAVQVTFENLQSTEEIKKICNSMYDVMLSRDMSLQINKFMNGTAFNIYDEGIACDCSVSSSNMNVAATAVKKDTYESGTYWTPNKMASQDMRAFTKTTNSNIASSASSSDMNVAATTAKKSTGTSQTTNKATSRVVSSSAKTNSNIKTTPPKSKGEKYGAFFREDDGSHIMIYDDGPGYYIELNIVRLTHIEGKGVANGEGIIFSGTDANGNVTHMELTYNDDNSQVSVIAVESTWEYLPIGEEFVFNKDEKFTS